MAYTLDIKNMSWVENTENEVDFIIKTMGLKGNEKILDLGCGFGRHSLSFAKRGFNVVGVDLTEVFIDDAKNEAHKNNLKIEFIKDDVRNLKYNEEFDVVLNLANDLLGTMETDEENLQLFNIISKALKKNGKHFMDIINGEHADTYFPKKHWQIGTKKLSLPEFLWNRETKRYIYREWEVNFGEILEMRKEKLEDFSNEKGMRLYTKEEIGELLKERKMEVVSTYSNYYGKKDSNKELQLIVYSRKEK